MSTQGSESASLMVSAEGEGMLLGFPEYRDPALDLATAGGLDFAEVDIHFFPDGESRIRLPEHLPERVYLCRSLNQPNQKLVELALAASTARTLGARKVGLIAPYLCYMRQDKAFHAGEAVSQRIVGDLLASLFDEVITVDPHLHRVKRLEAAIPVGKAIALQATHAMSDYLEGRLKDPLLVGPDEESRQWVAAIAQRNGLEFHVAHKQRRGDRDVDVTLPKTDFQGRNVVLVDDIASTGRTLEAACRQLESHQPASITVMVTHALFVGDAQQRIREAGAHDIWSCDSVVHSTNRIGLAKSIAAALVGL